MRDFFQMLAGFFLDIGVQAVPVRIHGDNRDEVVHAQVPHRLGNPELDQVHAQHLVDQRA